MKTYKVLIQGNHWERMIFIKSENLEKAKTKGIELAKEHNAKFISVEHEIIKIKKPRA